MMELVCPAGNLASLKAAVDNGADAVYIGFNDKTNARSFSGLNFSDKQVERALEYVKANDKKLFVAINTYPDPEKITIWREAVDKAAQIQADALILADVGLMSYASAKHSQLNLHLSVQASATNIESLRFYQTNFNIRRAVLPRVLSMKQVRQLAENAPCDLEVFGFGSLCIMAEGRCHLSSYVTGESPNIAGVCSPAGAVEWCETPSGGLQTRLNGILVDQYAPGEHAAYPTLCKGRFQVEGNRVHALEEPTSLNTLELIPELDRCGIKAIKIEGRQRSPAYVAQVVQTWRNALDDYYIHRTKGLALAEKQKKWDDMLRKHSEGKQTTLGAYTRTWQ